MPHMLGDQTDGQRTEPAVESLPVAPAADNDIISRFSREGGEQRDRSFRPAAP